MANSRGYLYRDFEAQLTASIVEASSLGGGDNGSSIATVSPGSQTYRRFAVDWAHATKEKAAAAAKAAADRPRVEIMAFGGPSIYFFFEISRLLLLPRLRRQFL